MDSNKILLRLFPYLEDKDKASELKIDQDSMHYISIKEVANKISNIIKSHLQEIKLNYNNSIITDATAGVGGNTISFAKNFKFVYSVEIDKTRSEYLLNNINVYNLKNVKVINDDCLNVINKIDNHDVVFIDPPWGGRSYKDFKMLKLNISNISLETLCNNIFDKQKMKCTPNIIVLKLPVNYNLRYLYQKIMSSKIYFYDLKKMFIIVIIKI